MKIDEDTFYNLFILVVLLIGLAVGFILGQQDITKDNTTQELNQSIFETINANCGSVFITKQYGDENWYVFTKTCKDQDFCKYDYIKVEKCLN